MHSSISKNIDKGLLHLLIAFILLPGYFFLGIEYKIVLIPYVLFLLFSKKAIYYPALIIHFLPGTMISQIILLGCLVLSLGDIKILRQYRVSSMYILSISSFILLVYISIQKAYDLNYSIIDNLKDLAVYLGFFGFYYGVLVSAQFNRRIIERVLWVLLFSVVLQALIADDGTIRYYFLALPLFITITIAKLITRRKISVSSIFIYISVLILVLVRLGRIELTFTLIMTTFISILIVFLYERFKTLFLEIRTGTIFAILIIFLTVYVVNNPQFTGRPSDFETVNGITNISDLLTAFEFKAFGDRGVLWIGTWNTLIRDYYIWPPFKPSDIEFELYKGTLIDVSYGAHNIVLELIRQYGFMVGLSGVIIYLLIMMKLGKALSLTNSGPLMVIVGAVVLSTAFVGGLVGHFVLINNFSFLLMSLCGICYGVFIRTSWKNKLYDMGIEGQDCQKHSGWCQ